MTHKSHSEDSSREIAVLTEIKESEEKADAILEKAKSERDLIIQQAKLDASKLIAEKAADIKKAQEKKLMDFKDRVKLLSEEKIIEGKTLAKQLKSKADKNSSKAIELVLKKFEEMI